MTNEWTDLLMTDHETTERVFDAADKAFREDGGPSPAFVRDLLDYFRTYVDGCHNQKEEQHVFPLIERRGIPRDGGPLGVMLTEHEQSRDLLARLVSAGERYQAGERAVLDDLRRAFTDYSTLLKGHFWKENDILYPMARRVVSADDVQAILRGIEQAEAAIGPDARARYYALAEHIIDAGQVEDLSFGLDRSILAAMLNTLPVELSFVDADDRVRYFSHENSAKIFPRTRGVIGQPVQQCHPSKSVDKVNAILAAFKAGSRSVAEFWIQMQGKHLHIRYFPVRDGGGAYVGCLEVVQDITAIRQLEGERRLLDE